MSGRSVQYRRWLLGAALLGIGACGDENVTGPADPTAPSLDVSLTVADLSVPLTYGGQALTSLGLGQCYNGMYIFAIPSGKTRADNPPSAFACLNSTGAPSIKGLPPGDYSVEVRPNTWSKIAVASAPTTALAAGPNTLPLDLATNMGLVSGTVKINGQGPGTDYRVCYDDPQIGPAGQNFGTSSYCAYLSASTTLTMLAPAGTTTASIFNNMNSTKVATLTFDAVEAGHTTQISETNISLADVAVQTTFNGQPVSALGLSSCYNSALAFAIPSGASRGNNPPYRSGCFRDTPFSTIKGVTLGDYSIDLRPNYWSTFAFAPALDMTLVAGTNTATMDLAASSGIVTGSVAFNGQAAGTDYRVCFDDQQVGPQGQNFGLTAFCSYLSNGTFKIIVPAGVTSLFVANNSGSAKVAVLSFAAVEAGKTRTVEAANITTSDLTVKLTYDGQPATQVGSCYNGVVAFAIPTGKTRADNPPALSACFGATLGTLRGLTPGEYSLDLRSSTWAQAPLAAPLTLTLVQGANTATLDLATAAGVLTGTLTVNGQPATTDYRVCYDYQQTGPQGQNFGIGTYCAYVNNGSFKLFAPAGSLSASIMSSSNQKVASIATAIAAGETTTLGGIAVGTPGATLVGTNVEVHPVSSGVTDYAATLTFATVAADGITTLVKTAQGSAPPIGFVLGTSPVYYALSTTAQVSGTITVCIDYTGTTFMRPLGTRLLQRNAAGTAWTDVTFSRDVATRTICGRTTSLTSFVVVEAANRAPIISSATGSTTDIAATSALTVAEGTTVSFTGVATDADADPLALIWTFSDGAQSQSGPSIQRSFGDNSAAPVTATLTVKDAFGGTATRTVAVTVTNVAPTATFAPGTTSLIEGESFNLTFSNVVDVPADLPARYAFDCGMGNGFGDFGTSSEISCTATVSGQRAVKGRVRDKDGGTTEYTATVDVTSANRAPTADAGSNAAGGYRGSEGVSIAFDGSGSSDPDGDQVAYEWNFDGSLGQDGLLDVQARTAQPSFIYLDDGVYTATLTVRDGKGGTDTKTVQVTVANTNPTATFAASPTSVMSGESFSIALTGATDQSPVDRAAGFTYALHCGDTPAPASFDFGSASSATCRTAATRTSVTRTVLGLVRDKDQGVRQYSATVNVAGNRAPALSVPSSYRASEGESIALGWTASDPEGDAMTYTWDFGNGVTGSGARLPASYTYPDDAAGSGTFTITVTASDGLGAVTSTAVASIANVSPSISALSGVAVDPVAVGTSAATMLIGAPFTDPGLEDTHTGSLSCGNGTTVPAMISGGIASGRCTYAVAGVYRPSITVVDDDAGSTTRVADTYVVAYDPSAGFVTGGGWIRYDAASCTICGGQAGRGDFGFVAKYQKGATRPTGETRFEFHAGSLTFASYEYEWLVVGGGRAQFRGSGRINGQGDYRFILTAVDGSPDTFRIQIWEASKAEGEHTFDNHGDTALDKVSGNGSITIHSK